MKDLDLTVPIGEGLLNVRVGAIIMKDDKVLLAGNDQSDYLYSVGGRIKFGEIAEEAVVREVFEETGVKMEIDRLGFVHENFFYPDIEPYIGKMIYEISFFFYMKVPENFKPASINFTEVDHQEFLEWISLDTDKTIFPEFFRTELKHPSKEIKHMSTRNI